MNPLHTPPGAPHRDPATTHRLHVAVAVLLSALILANMALIFFFSSESGEESGNRSEGITDAVVDIVCPDYDDLPPAKQESLSVQIHHLVRKTAHFLEYALLGFLTACLLIHLRRRLIPRLSSPQAWIFPAAFGVIYAISDEVHQIFSGRGPRVTDVLIDGAGVVCGICVAHAAVWLIRYVRATKTMKQRRRPLGP